MISTKQKYTLAKRITDLVNAVGGMGVENLTLEQYIANVMEICCTTPEAYEKALHCFESLMQQAPVLGLANRQSAQSDVRSEQKSTHGYGLNKHTAKVSGRYAWMAEQARQRLQPIGKTHLDEGKRQEEAESA